jgi:hypothetical protein
MNTLERQEADPTTERIKLSTAFIKAVLAGENPRELLAFLDFVNNNLTVRQLREWGLVTLAERLQRGAA